MTIFNFNSGSIKHFQFLFTAVVIVLTVLSCEGKLDDTGIDGLDPDIVGGVLLKDTIDVRSVTHFGSFMDSISTGNAQRLYLGQSGGNQFRIIFYFSIPTNLDCVIVSDGVRFNMVSAGSYGGTGLSSFTASVHPILRDWGENDVRWDRFQFGRDFGPAFGYFQVSSNDTQKTIISVPIPKDTVQQWVDAISDTNKKNFGILIDFSGDANFVHQYYGGGVTVSSGSTTPDAGYAPKLFFKWYKIGTTVTVDSTTIFPVTLSSGFSRFSGGRQGYLYRESTPGAGNQLWVGSGIPYHSFIRFASDSFPKSSTISQAIMTMRIDTTEVGWVVGASRTLQTVRVTTKPADWKSGGIGLNETDSYLIGFESTDQYRWLTGKVKGDTVTFNVTQQLQSWVTNPSSNSGLQIFHANELTGDFNDIYRMKIRLDSTDPERSPKIVVYYTVPSGK